MTMLKSARVCVHLLSSWSSLILSLSIFLSIDLLFFSTFMIDLDLDCQIDVGCFLNPCIHGFGMARFNRGAGAQLSKPLAIRSDRRRRPITAADRSSFIVST
jgi:hypothetical protein